MKSMLWYLVLVIIIVFHPLPALAQPVPQSRHYMLLADSYLLDDCPICGRPSIMLPLRGSFDLVFTENSCSFRIINLGATALGYSVHGEGTLTFDQNTKSQEAIFNLQIKKGEEPVENLVFTNKVKEIPRGFPMIDFAIEETPGSLFRLYSVRIAAAPLKDLWFTTTDSFVDQSIAGTKVERSGGDILSINGNVIKTWESLVQNFNLLQPNTNVGIDVFATNLAGEFLVSLVDDHQTTSGTLSHGDLLNPNGSVLVALSDLVTAFQFKLVGNPGLDAYFSVTNGPTLFSLTSDQYSSKLDQTVSSGDLLAKDGTIYKTSQTLLSKFMPALPEHEYGLDALFIWPGGEIWFSTQEDFISQVFGQIYSGDILSDAGYIVFRNRDLLQLFHPEGETGNYGLDGIMIFPDLSDWSKLPLVSITKEGTTLTIHWQGNNTEYRLEKADNVQGPYQTIADWSSATFWTGNADSASGFFRVAAR